MKKTLTILILLISSVTKGQLPIHPMPTDTAIHTIPTYSFRQYTADTSTWMYKGLKYPPAKLAEYYKTQWKIDSIRNEMYSKMYEIEVDTEDQTSYVLPFPLRTKTMVYYNGQLLRSSQWFGVGTTYLTVGVETQIKDYIKIQN